MSQALDNSDRIGAEFRLSAKHIGKVYGLTRVLSDVRFEIGSGEVVGLIGANGAGKSTLIKCLTGAVTPDEGTLGVNGDTVSLGGPDDALTYGLAAVPQEVTLTNDRTVGETILLGCMPSKWGFTSQKRLNARAREFLRLVQLPDLDPNTLTGSLTPTAKRLVMVASVLARHPRLVILDEPTAALPPEESEVIYRLVRDVSAAGVAVVYVSHRLHEVKDLCSRVVALRNGSLAGELEGDEITRHRMIALIGGSVEPDTLLVSEEHSHDEARPRGDVALEVRNVSGNRVRDVSFTAYQGEILGIAGLAGSGRSELLRLIYGLQSLTAGEIRFAGRTLTGGPRKRMRNHIGYLAELRGSNILRGLNVVRNLTCSSTGDNARYHLFADAAWERRVTEDTARDVRLVGKPTALIENLSGGNQQKVLIGRWLACDTELFLLDEPTSGVDLLARKEIHDLLRRITEDGRTAIVASVEADELTTICDRVLVMVEGRIETMLLPPFTEEQLVASLFQHRNSERAVS